MKVIWIKYALLFLLVFQSLAATLQAAVPQTIKHRAVQQVSGQTVIAATIANAKRAHVVYITNPLFRPERLEMTKRGTTFTATLNAAELWSNRIQYRIETDTASLPNDNSYVEATVKSWPLVEAKIPSLLVTEILVDSTGIHSNDDYEFIELYNNKNEPQSTEGMELVYRSPSGQTESVLPLPTRRIAPYETLIIWPKHRDNKEKTLAEFNAFMKTTIVPAQMIELHWKGMNNKAERTISIRDDAQQDIVRAHYVPADVVENESLVYHYHDTTTMARMGIALKATPGKVERDQVPSPLASPLPLKIAHTPLTTYRPNELVTFTAKTSQVADVYVKYREQNSEWKQLPLKADGTTYRAALFVGDILSMEYEIIAQMGTMQTTTGLQTMTVHREYDFSEAPQVVVTEMMVDSINIGHSDGYEYIELYNNTDHALELSDYQLVYRSLEGSQQDVIRPLPQRTWVAQQPLVVWFINEANKAKTIADFTDRYHNKSDDVVKFPFTSLVNTGAYEVQVTKRSDASIMSAARYIAAEVKQGKALHYRFHNYDKLVVNSAGSEPTPTKISAGQVPAYPVRTPKDNEVPTIVLDEWREEKDELVLTATMYDNVAVKETTVHYRLGNSTTELTLPLRLSKDGLYEARLPLAETLVYYVTATDGRNEARTEETRWTKKEFAMNPRVTSPLFITEIVADSKNRDGLDCYDFVEVFNNSNRPLSWRDYVLRYRYPMEGAVADLYWERLSSDVTIPAGEAIVFWLMNRANKSLTVADFNAHFNTKLVEGKSLIKLYNAGMANQDMRALVIATKAGKELSLAVYNDEIDKGKDDTNRDKGIMYHYSPDGQVKMVKQSAGVEAASPGTVTKQQVPATRVIIANDDMPPTYEVKTRAKLAKQGENVELLVQAVDDVAVKTVQLSYEIDGGPTTEVSLTRDATDQLFHHTLYAPQFIGKRKVTYRYHIRDGQNETVTRTETLPIERSNEPTVVLNVKEADVVAKTKWLQTTATELKLDGQPLSGGQPSITHMPLFSFEVSKTNLFFKNGVTMGTDLLRVFDDEHQQYVTLSTPIPLEKLQQGKAVQISIRAGTKITPFEAPKEDNRDDFYVKNVRLILPDGTALYDRDRAEVLSSGDALGNESAFTFSFTIPDSYWTARAYMIDTTRLTNGRHELIAGTTKRTIIVDNEQPFIDVLAPARIKGTIQLRANVSDRHSSLQEVKATLNGVPITLPYTVSSAKLQAGRHVLRVTAKDAAGNVREVKKTLFSDREQPNEPTLVASTQNSVAATPKLTLNVSDPTNDDMTVQFQKGYAYRSTSTGVTIKANAVPTEPPLEFVPRTEQAVTAETVKAIEKVDGRYDEQRSLQQFPYIRFDVNVDPTVRPNHVIEVTWKGKSLPNRKVTMYGWNFMDAKWRPLATAIAGTADFTLVGLASYNEYVRNGKLHAIVQDEVAPMRKNFDYTLVWMSDTQYYAESYPYIYEREVQWMKQQKETLKIKYVFHTGDLVDKSYQKFQWRTADRNMKALDEANVPYGVLAGNHDVNHKAEDYAKYSHYFGDARFSSREWFGASYKNNRGHYDLVSANGNDFMFVYMGWGIYDEQLNWLNDVIRQHPDRLVILSFHEYLLVTGGRSPIGERIFNEVIKPNKNVIGVLSGHYHDSETLIDAIDDNGDGIPDRKVFQMLADYQGGPEGGQGYIRLLHIDQANNKIHVKTYSPYKKDYNYYDPSLFPNKDEFMLDVQLTPQEKLVATDYFGINIYTNETIATVTNVKSGAKVSAFWSDALTAKEAMWYATVSDRFGGLTRSDIYRFRRATTAPLQLTPAPTPKKSMRVDHKMRPVFTLLRDDTLPLGDIRLRAKERTTLAVTRYASLVQLGWPLMKGNHIDNVSRIETRVPLVVETRHQLVQLVVMRGQLVAVPTSSLVDDRQYIATIRRLPTLKASKTVEGGKTTYRTGRNQTLYYTQNRALTRGSFVNVMRLNQWQKAHGPIQFKTGTIVYVMAEENGVFTTIKEW